MTIILRFVSIKENSVRVHFHLSYDVWYLYIFTR